MKLHTAIYWGLVALTLGACSDTAGTGDGSEDSHLEPWLYSDKPEGDVIVAKREEGLELARYLAYAPYALDDMGIEYSVGGETQGVGRDEALVDEVRVFKYPMSCMRLGSHRFSSEPPTDSEGEPVYGDYNQWASPWNNYLYVNLFGQVDDYAQLGGYKTGPAHTGAGSPNRLLHFQFVYSYQGGTFDHEAVEWQRPSDRQDPDSWRLIKAELVGARNNIGPCPSLNQGTDATVYSEHFLKVFSREGGRYKAAIWRGDFDRNVRDLSVPWEAVRAEPDAEPSQRNSKGYYETNKAMSTSAVVKVEKVLSPVTLRVQPADGRRRGDLSDLAAYADNLFQWTPEETAAALSAKFIEGEGLAVRSMTVEVANVAIVPGKEQRAMEVAKKWLEGEQVKLICRRQAVNGKPLCSVLRWPSSKWYEADLMYNGLAWLDYSRGVEPYERYKLEERYLDAMKAGRFGEGRSIARHD